MSAGKGSLGVRAGRALWLALVIINGIERRPRMYGWTPDSIEARFLAAVTFREALVGSGIDVSEAFERFMVALYGGPINTPLWCILRAHDMLDEHARLLGDFGRWVEAGAP